MNAGIRRHSTDNAIDALKLKNRGERIGKAFTERPAAGDIVKSLVRGSGHCSVARSA